MCRVARTRAAMRVAVEADAACDRWMMRARCVTSCAAVHATTKVASHARPTRVLVSPSDGSRLSRVIVTELNDLALSRHRDHRANRFHDRVWLTERDDVTRSFCDHLTSLRGQRHLVTLHALPFGVRT